MSSSLTTEKIDWLERALGVKVPAVGLGNAQLATPTDQAPADSASPSEADGGSAVPNLIANLSMGSDGIVNFDIPKDAGVPPPSGPNKAKFDADAQKLQTGLADVKTRGAKITIVTYENAALIKSLQKAGDAYNAAANEGLKKGDLSDALKAFTVMDNALKAVEADAVKRKAELPKKQKAATDAGDKVDKMSDADVAKMKPEDKAALVKAMLGAGKPTGATREAQKKLYRNAGIDPDFKKDDEAKQDKVAADLKGDADLAKARGDWAKQDIAGLRKQLGKVVAAQSKEYGISPPPIIFFPAEEKPVSKAAGIVAGYFNDQDGKLHINNDPNSGIKDFVSTITVVLHENAHHYQNELVKLLQAGKLTASDKRYKQALVLEANSLEPGGYIDPDESPKPKGFNDYQDQPLEVGARETGTSTAKKIGSVVVPPKSGP